MEETKGLMPRMHELQRLRDSRKCQSIERPGNICSPEHVLYECLEMKFVKCLLRFFRGSTSMLIA